MRQLIWKLIKENIESTIVMLLICVLAVLLRHLLHLHDPAFLGLLFGMGFLAGLLMP